MRKRESRRPRTPRACEILELAARFATQPDQPLELPPDEGTLENLDMLIHDCRQYLMIATGELKNNTEEGILDLDEPTNDIAKITIRLKRLKSQCMRFAGWKDLDWMELSNDLRNKRHSEKDPEEEEDSED